MAEPGVAEQRDGLAAYWGTSYFPALDGLRAICILLVMFNHVHELVPRGVQGRVGVDIFFVLSGFLITTLLVREKERYGNVSLKGFYTRRFFRIVPVYALVVVGYLGLAYFSGDVRWRDFKAALPYLVSFMQEFRPASTGVMLGHAWSLGIEEKFYLGWPVLLLALFPFRWRSVAVLLGLGLVTVLLPDKFSRSYGGLLLGALLAVSLAESSVAGLRKVWMGLRTGSALGLVVVSYLGLALYGLPVLWFSGCVTLLIGALVLRQSWVRSLLERRWMVVCGKRSYAMYLVHILAIDAVEWVAVRTHLARWYFVIPVAYGLSFVTATAIFYLVERPAITFGRNVARGMRERLAGQVNG